MQSLCCHSFCGMHIPACLALQSGPQARSLWQLACWPVGSPTLKAALFILSSYRGGGPGAAVLSRLLFVDLLSIHHGPWHSLDSHTVQLDGCYRAVAQEEECLHLICTLATGACQQCSMHAHASHPGLARSWVPHMCTDLIAVEQPFCWSSPMKHARHSWRQQCESDVMSIGFM